MFGQIKPRFGLKIGVQNHKKFELGARFYAYRQKVLGLHMFGRIMMIKIMKLFQENFKVFTEHLRNRVRSSDIFWGFVLYLSLIIFILTRFIFKFLKIRILNYKKQIFLRISMSFVFWGTTKND